MNVAVLIRGNISTTIASLLSVNKSVVSVWVSNAILLLVLHCCSALVTFVLRCNVNPSLTACQ